MKAIVSCVDLYFTPSPPLFTDQLTSAVHSALAECSRSVGDVQALDDALVDVQAVPSGRVAVVRVVELPAGSRSADAVR